MFFFICLKVFVGGAFVYVCVTYKYVFLVPAHTKSFMYYKHTHILNWPLN